MSDSITDEYPPEFEALAAKYRQQKPDNGQGTLESPYNLTLPSKAIVPTTTRLLNKMRTTVVIDAPNNAVEHTMLGTEHDSDEEARCFAHLLVAMKCYENLLYHDAIWDWAHNHGLYDAFWWSDLNKHKDTPRLLHALRELHITIGVASPYLGVKLESEHGITYRVMRKSRVCFPKSESTLDPSETVEAAEPLAVA